MKLSVVTSFYRTAQFAEEFVRRVDGAALSCGLDEYELIAVVDGSPDDSVAVLRSLQPRFPRLRIIELSRNFGHHPALWCGLSAARGDLVFLADSDLETPPEVLAELQAALQPGEVDMAYGLAEHRPGPWARRFASALFWRAFNVLAGTAIRTGTVTERLMRRNFLDALLTLQERTLFLTGMMDWIGFPTVAVSVPRRCRVGRPSYTWAHRIRLAIDAVTSFSVVPMRLMIGVGAVLAGLALATAVGLVCIKLLDRSAIVTGFTALAVMLLFTLGALLAALGVLGLYVGNVFLQAKQRPLFIIRREF